MVNKSTKNLNKTQKIYVAQKNKKSFKKPAKNTAPKVIVLSVIGLAALAVISFLAFSILNQPEKVAKAKIDSLAKDYYENFYYKNMTESPYYSGNAEATLSGNAEKGIAPLNLDRLYHTNEEKYADDIHYIEKYCNLEKTVVRLYPEAPYEKNSVRTEVDYSCNF